MIICSRLIENKFVFKVSFTLKNKTKNMSPNRPNNKATKRKYGDIDESLLLQKDAVLSQRRLFKTNVA